MTDNFSLADIKAVTDGNHNGGFGSYGMESIFFLFFILLFVGGGMGFGGFGNGGVTRTDLADSFNFNTIDNELRQIGNGIAQSNYSLSNELSTFRMENAKCCCETQRELLGNRYAAEKNTCDIVNAIHADGEATRALINSNTMQDLRDRLEQSERNTMAAQFQLSQKAQTESLVNELRPCAKPSYIAASPYAVYYPTPNCNYGCGGCNGF